MEVVLHEHLLNFEVLHCGRDDDFCNHLDASKNGLGLSNLLCRVEDLAPCSSRFAYSISNKLLESLDQEN